MTIAWFHSKNTVSRKVKFMEKWNGGYQKPGGMDHGKLLFGRYKASNEMLKML